MGKILLESVKQPGVTRQFTRYEAKVLLRLGRWRFPAGAAAAMEAPKPGHRHHDNKGHAAFDAVAERHNGIEFATVAELEDVADAYDFNADALKGTGAGGNVLKTDWLAELKRRRAGAGQGRYKRRDMQAETE